MSTAQFHLLLATLLLVSLSHLKRSNAAVPLHVMLIFIHGSLALIHRFYT